MLELVLINLKRFYISVIRCSLPVSTYYWLVLSGIRMSGKQIRRLRVFISSILSKQSSSQVFCQPNSSFKVNRMDAVKAMKEMGYAFNVEGQLRKLGPDGQVTDEPFLFNVSNRHQECQAHYEKLGDAITEYIYHLLETDLKLTRLGVPKDEQGTFIFVSKDYDKKNVLMILIHGSGAVRAGQWARSLIINYNIDMGTQIPYIKKALAKDYGVMVLNTNDNYLANGKEIKHSSTGEEHAIYVWDTFVKKCLAKSIVIVAHSYGGVVTVALADKMKTEFEKWVKAIAFTDSVHGYSNIRVTEHLRNITRNWISSSEPLDTPVATPEFDIDQVSAGHQKHEMTSYSCMESVFKFIDEKLSKH